MEIRYLEAGTGVTAKTIRYYEQVGVLPPPRRKPNGYREYDDNDKENFAMTDSCGCPSEAGNEVCELPAENIQRPLRAINACPVCGGKGKAVQGQTVKALLSVSLREVQDVEYLFCKTPTCAVVYFAPDGKQTFRVEQIRERVYQKEPESDDVLVCYCFRHKVGELRTAASETRMAILNDINTGINAGQCACDLRNPQGSCCLGNVRGLIKRIDTLADTAEEVDQVAGDEISK